jgi:acetolactate synthase-1/2/3 large subunit
MGFGIPAAVGASLAVPRRPVVAAVGDGGLLMSAMEVLTAVELGLSLKILVFCDGRLGLIHRQQMGGHGHAHGTELPSLDLALLARSLGAGHVRLAEGKAEDGLRAAMADPGVTLVEVPVGDSGWARVVRVRAMARNAVGNTRAGSLLRSLASRVRGRRDA